MVEIILTYIVLCEEFMKIINDENLLKRYIYNLEKENESLKKSYSFRLGKSIIDLKNTVKNKQVHDLIPSTKKVFNATKKAGRSPLHAKINLEEILEKKSKILKSTRYVEKKLEKSDGAIEYYLIPRVKYSKVIGIFSQKSFQDLHILLTPDNYQEVILSSNIDMIVFDLKEIIENPSWFALGTYEAINILRILVNAINNNNKISTVLIESADISSLPLFLELKKIDFFDFIEPMS